MLERAIAMSLEVEEEPFSIEGEFLKKQARKLQATLVRNYDSLTY